MHYFKVILPYSPLAIISSQKTNQRRSMYVSLLLKPNYFFLILRQYKST